MHETAPAESSSSSAVECQYALWQIPGTFAEDHLQLLNSPSCLARLPNCTQPPFATVIPSHQKFAVPNSTSMSGEPERPPSFDSASLDFACELGSLLSIKTLAHRSDKMRCPASGRCPVTTLASRTRPEYPAQRAGH